MPVRLRLSDPSESIAIVKEKERAMTALSSRHGPLARWKDAADAWCAAALWPGPRPSAAVVREWIAAATGAATTLPDSQLRSSLAARARDLGESLGLPLGARIPEAFFDTDGQLAPDGGFDAVIGNPPWALLPASDGYRHQARGHLNSYQLFLDRALQLTKARRTRWLDPAVRHRYRSWERGVAPSSVRSHVDRHVDWIRQPQADFSDSPQRPVRGDGDDERGQDGHAQNPIRPDRSPRARSGRRASYVARLTAIAN
jgi:hypothetical protein